MTEKDRVEEHLKMMGKKMPYYSEKGMMLLNNVAEMIAQEGLWLKIENNINISDVKIQLLNDPHINGFSTKIDDEYYIFINKGVLEEQKVYLKYLNWNFLDNVSCDTYIDELIKYGFYFYVFHEYMHICFGHADAKLSDTNDKKAQECEADLKAVQYLIIYISLSTESKRICNELVKLLLAIILLFDNMQNQTSCQEYNHRLIENYYDSEKVAKRDHPLFFQRMNYILNDLGVKSALTHY